MMRASIVGALRVLAGSLRGVSASGSGQPLGSAGSPTVLRGVARGHRQARVAALGAIAAAVPESVAVGDFNGDGRADLAVANSGSGNVSVLLNATPTIVPTTTTLRAKGLDLPHILFAGKLVANVAPNTATGTIQFKQNGGNFGAPIRVTSGTASTSSLNLLFTNTYTAVFTPDNSAAFGSSTSNAVTLP